jgi:hypothetical protein
MVFCLAAVALLLGGVGQSSQAGPITGLFNTGVDGSGTPLADGTIGDPHYSLVSVPSGTKEILVLRAKGGYPIPPWVGDDNISAWIGPNNSGINGTDRTGDSPSGSFDYRTTFDLNGLNPSTASISGQWSMDNEGVDILINSVPTGNSSPSDTSFTSFHSFSISSGFVAGSNTLDFIVHNDASWTGLRVEMTGTANPAASVVPEPTTLTLMGIGLFRGVTALPQAVWVRCG